MDWPNDAPAVTAIVAALVSFIIALAAKATNGPVTVGFATLPDSPVDSLPLCSAAESDR